jgi:hypothetical protein
MVRESSLDNNRWMLALSSTVVRVLVFWRVPYHSQGIAVLTEDIHVETFFLLSSSFRDFAVRDAVS